jgi:hypothetical protein
MAYARLPNPGTEYGPCAGQCSHTDCTQTRAMAAQLCPRCNLAIGYEQKFIRDSRDRLMHWVCACQEAEDARATEGGKD